MPANSASLAAEAYTVVRRRIVRGEMAIGQSVSRRKLAAELGMSFLPVSEALLRLEFEGMLESRPRAGTRVRIPSHEDVVGHFTVREALEGQAAMLFSHAATAAERSQLRKLAARVDAVATQPDRRLYTMLHHKLHRRIAECARCPMLSEAIEKVHGPNGTPVGISIGVVSSPQHAVEADRLLDLADAAMYRAKAAGARVIVCEPETDARAEADNGP